MMNTSSQQHQRKEPLLTVDTATDRLGEGGGHDPNEKPGTTVLPHALETEHRDASSATPEKSCCEEYFQDCLWPGLGLFGESYLLFSVGTLQPLWSILFPSCFATYEIKEQRPPLT